MPDRKSGRLHWAEHPTVPLDRVRAALNLDMVGRLRDDRLTVYGTRSGFGLRRLVSRQNEDPGLTIDFSWELEDDADHWTFFDRRIPVLFLHTGLHDEFHSPRDDAQRIDSRGMNRVARLAFHLLYDLAERPEVPRFREAARRETEKLREQLASETPKLRDRLGANWQVQLDGKPMRLGITFLDDDAEPGTVVITYVVAGSPAAEAGLQAGDRIYQVDGNDFADQRVLLELLGAASDRLPLLIERQGQLRTVVVYFQEDLQARAA
ncbi:MAG TPA: M28 family peptidase [Thermoguttaceae bacterium]|nr:M28 family peptidase [Thermoguttaceae bacterium]